MLTDTYKYYKNQKFLYEALFLIYLQSTWTVFYKINIMLTSTDAFMTFKSYLLRSFKKAIGYKVKY